MLTFKEFRLKQTISETIIPDHLRHIPENWDHHANLSQETHDKFSHAFGAKGFTVIPIPKQGHGDMDSDVAEHLTKHDWDVSDYQKGIAQKKVIVNHPQNGPQEKIVSKSIGKVLDETNASDDIKKTFINDPARASTKALSGKQTYALIAHSPVAIASSTSPGCSWETQSCMNLESGIHRRYLRDDSENGSVVAFEVHHDDEGAMKWGEPDKPLARISAKPMHEEPDDHESDTIVRAEDKVWGSSSSAFPHVFNTFLTNSFPAKDGTTYHLNSKIYNDTMGSTYSAMSKDQVEDKINRNKPLVDKTGTGLDKPIIDHAILHGKQYSLDKPTFVSNMAQVGNLSVQHVAALHKLIDGHNITDENKAAVRTLAMLHGDKFSTNAINSFAASNQGIPRRMLMNSKLHESLVDQVNPDDYIHVRRSLLKPKHYDKVVDNYVNNMSGSAYPVREHAGYFSKENLDKLTTNMRNSDLVNILPKNENFTQEHHDAFVNNLSNSYKFSNTHQLMRNSKFASFDDLSQFANSHNHGVDLAENPNISTDTKVKLKNRFVNEKTFPIRANAIFDKVNKIPEAISSVMTSSDHDELAKTGKQFYFEDAKSSNDHLKAHQKLVEDADQKITDHIDAQKAKHPDDLYDPDEDEEKGNLQDALHGRIESYVSNIDNHLDKHATDGSTHRNELIRNYPQMEVAEKHLGNLDVLENYKTENNSSRYDDTEHFNDYVKEVHERISDAKQRTDEHDEFGDDNW